MIEEIDFEKLIKDLGIGADNKYDYDLMFILVGGFNSTIDEVDRVISILKDLGYKNSNED